MRRARLRATRESISRGINLEFRLGRSHTSRARSERRRGRAPRPSPKGAENLFARAASSELEKAR